jgi:diaminopimelate decarboxylase
MYLHGTSRINEKGRLEIGGCDTVDLAEQFGTPLYVYDEEMIRDICRAYKQAFAETGLRYQVAYASKAFSSLAMCRLVAEEGLSLDVVSAGELFTAAQAGFPVERIHFHGNNKSPDELDYALQMGVGEFVVDNFYELNLLGQLAFGRGQTVPILLRVTPGVEAHTHEYISTGQQDSKFGFDVASGQAKIAIETALRTKGVKLGGLHSHIGSQIFETEGFAVAISRVAELYEWTSQEFAVNFDRLNVGGGFGIRYIAEDQPLRPKDYVRAIADAVKSEFAVRGLDDPEVIIEPGRSIVGAAGTTLYTVGSSKTIPGIRKYIAVDGGMSDNPRPALYQAEHEAILANRAREAAEETVSVAGKCCESGDMLIWDLQLPPAESSDILAVTCTGAYNYSMASNYNRLPRPAAVFVKNGRADLIIRRETLEDLIRNDLLPERMTAEVGK